jgi:hypothetical protein
LHFGHSPQGYDCTILDQIEGAMAYLDTVGTRAADSAYKRLRLALESAHRTLHNRLHQQGYYHEHTPANEHAEHRCSGTQSL